jgi:hypothetical protein
MVIARWSHASWVIVTMLFGGAISPIALGISAAKEPELALLCGCMMLVPAAFAVVVIRGRKDLCIKVGAGHFELGNFKQPLDSIRRFRVIRPQQGFLLVLEFEPGILSKNFDGFPVRKRNLLVEDDTLAVNLYPFSMREQKAVVEELLQLIPEALADRDGVDALLAYRMSLREIIRYGARH